jgi:hypothetical protein
VEVFEMPHGNFDKPPETMQISADGKSLEACGPLLWSGDEPHDRPAQSLTIQSVEIKQSRARAAKNPGVQFARDEEEWMVASVPSDGSGTFEDGQAHAEAQVQVVLEDGSVINERWKENVELSH